MKKVIRLSENDIKKMVLEAFNEYGGKDINPAWRMKSMGEIPIIGHKEDDCQKEVAMYREMYYRVYNCIHRLCDAMLGPDFIAGDTMTGPQAAEAITDEIIRRYGNVRR